MRTKATIGVAIAATALGAIGIASAAATPGGPEPAPPASPGSPYSQLSERNQLKTIATGSTAGFDADPALPGQTTTPGATGWWGLDYKHGASFSISSCGSSYPVAMTVYDIFARTDDAYTIVDSTDDACADPIEARYFGGLFNSGPDAVRIDDASGVGGDYVVRYKREPVDLEVEIKGIKVGKVAPLERRRRHGEATITPQIHLDGEFPLRRLQCTLDGRKLEMCFVDVEGVRSGEHKYRIVVVDRFGDKQSDAKKFKVPYLH